MDVCVFVFACMLCVFVFALQSNTPDTSEKQIVTTAIFLFVFAQVFVFVVVVAHVCICICLCVLCICMYLRSRATRLTPSRTNHAPMFSYQYLHMYLYFHSYLYLYLCILCLLCLLYIAPGTCLTPGRNKSYPLLRNIAVVFLFAIIFTFCYLPYPFKYLPYINFLLF